MVNISKKYYKFVRIMILQGIYRYSFTKETELKNGWVSMIILQFINILYIIRRGKVFG